MGAYIFLGPELGKKQDAVDSVKKKYPGAEEHVFYAGEISASAIADTVQNHSLFAESRIVIIKNAENFSGKKKDDIEILVSCIKNIENNTAAACSAVACSAVACNALILLSDETKITAALEDSVPKANKQIFYEMFEREKSEWLRGFFKREGFDIDNDCIDIILELVENNTAALKKECSGLISFLPKGKKITASDIEKWLSHNREESASTLFSRIAAGNLGKSLESTAVMLAAKESAVGILAGLAWRFRKLYDYLSLLEKGEANNSLELRKAGLSVPKIKDDYAAASRRYNADAVEKCLALTAEYDILLRSPAAALENILMDRYVVTLINSADNRQ
jgi:DNA polymerase-3 subunit delta